MSVCVALQQTICSGCMLPLLNSSWVDYSRPVTPMAGWVVLFKYIVLTDLLKISLCCMHEVFTDHEHSGCLQ